MLYYLQNIHNDKTFYLVNQNEFIVGRKNCDILLENDSSISRAHAKICVKDDNRVTIVDLKSKYKTSVNVKNLDPNIEVELNDGDEILFGGINSKFIFKQIKCVTTASHLLSHQKDILKKQLVLLQGRYVDNWTSECTHLTLEKISLTVKVLHALLEDKPIVLPSFWAKFAENVTKQLPPPNIAEYNDPPLTETLLNKVEFKNIKPRKDLFKDKIFLFTLEKERKQVEELIEKAGGSSLSWEKKPLKFLEVTEYPEKFLLMQNNKESDDKTYKQIVKYFSKLNKRMIPTQEIAMAIIHGSCEKDCNPDFNRAKEVFSIFKQKQSLQHRKLVQDTESEGLSEGVSQFQSVIPETEPNETDLSVRIGEKVTEDVQSSSKNNDKEISKRANEDDNDQNPFKKIKLEIIGKRTSQQENRGNDVSSSSNMNEIFLSKDTQTNKRKATTDSDSEGAPSKKALASNPFSSFMKRNKKRESVQSGSQSIRKQNESRSPSPENPFGRNKSLFTSTQKEQTKMCKEEPVYYTKTSSDNEESNSIWMSKNTDCDVNQEIEVDNNDTESDIKDIINLFSSNIIVDFLPDNTLRSRTYRDEVDTTHDSNLKNFKKFKKLKPLHPQTTIITEDSFAVVGYYDEPGVQDFKRKHIYDSDDEQASVSSSKQKRKIFTI